MRYGIYYAYWESEWRADYKYYIKKVADLGFDILEIAASPLPDYSSKDISELKACARHFDIILTVSHGPDASQNLSSTNASIRNNAKNFYANLFKLLQKLDIHLIIGAIHSYWPVDYTKPLDKKKDWELSIKGVHEIAKIAEACEVVICLEVLNRFENYLINTAEEGLNFIKQVNHPSVKILLDTFHMNIEEDSIGRAIRKTGSHLGHLHVGECNRKVPGKGRMPWNEIRDALHDIGYTDGVVLEPFVKMGGTVGSDIKVWRDISCGADENKLDIDAHNSLTFCRYLFE